MSTPPVPLVGYGTFTFTIDPITANLALFNASYALPCSLFFIMIYLYSYNCELAECESVMLLVWVVSREPGTASMDRVSVS